MAEVRAASAPAATGGTGPAASRRSPAEDRGARDGGAVVGVAAGDRLRDGVDEGGGGGGGLLGCETGAEEACCCIAVGTVDHPETKFEILVRFPLVGLSRFRHKCGAVELRLLSSLSRF